MNAKEWRFHSRPDLVPSQLTGAEFAAAGELEDVLARPSVRGSSEIQLLVGNAVFFLSLIHFKVFKLESRTL